MSNYQTLPRLSFIYKQNIKEKIIKKMESSSKFKKLSNKTKHENNEVQNEIECSHNFININKLKQQKSFNLV